MKLSNKPRHFASRNRTINSNANRSGGRRRQGSSMSQFLTPRSVSGSHGQDYLQQLVGFLASMMQKRERAFMRRKAGV